MGDEPRGPLFVVAIILMVVVVGLELGSQFVTKPPHQADRAAKVLTLPGVAAMTSGAQPDRAEVADQAAGHPQPAGLAIGYQALVDGLLLVMVVLAGFALRSADPDAGSALGAASLTAAMVAILGGIFMVDVAVGRLRSVVALFLSPPSGTLIYLTLFGFFNRYRSFVVLGVLVVAKLAFCVVLMEADHRFTRFRLLVGLMVTSVVMTVLVVGLLSVVPLTMVSITDSIAAVVVTVVGVVWAVVLLIASMSAVVSDLRFGRATSAPAAS